MGASSISLCHSRLQVEEVLAEMVRLASGKQVAIFACGNIKGDGWAFVDFFERNGKNCNMLISHVVAIGMVVGFCFQNLRPFCRRHCRTRVLSLFLGQSLQAVDDTCCCIAH